MTRERRLPELSSYISRKAFSTPREFALVYFLICFLRLPPDDGSDTGGHAASFADIRFLRDVAFSFAAAAEMRCRLRAPLFCRQLDI